MRWHRRTADGDAAIVTVRCPGCDDDRVEILGRGVVTCVAGVVATAAPRTVERRERALGVCHGCGLVSDVQVIDDASGAASSDLSMTAFLDAALDALRRSAGEWPAITRVRDASLLWERAHRSPLPATERRWFTPGALARTLRRAGLRIDALRLDPSGGLVAEVRDATPDAESFGVERAVEVDVAAARRYVERRGAVLDELRGRIAAEVAAGGTVAVWRAAATTVALLDELGEGVDVGAVVDVDPLMIGNHVIGHGLPIVAVGEPTVVPSLVVVAHLDDEQAAMAAFTQVEHTPSFV